MVGTGDRGNGMWGVPVIKEFEGIAEFVGLCDINPGRVQTAKQFMDLNCPTYTDFDKMMKETKPDMLIVTTVDGTHNEFIVKGMEYGADIITEKPMTTDETKCQQILDAEKKNG
jgi:predicted dehydrogenase